MNTKQLASLLLIAAMFGIVQLGLSFRKGAEQMEAKADKVAVEQAELNRQLALEQAGLAEVRSQSQGLIDFVAEWEPYFAMVEDQQAAETRVTMKVRESSLVNLSQRFQQIPHKVNGKDSTSLPVLVRASLVFEDNYAKLLNWLGELETVYPTMRIVRAALSKGSRGDDLRMELAVEIPLRKQKGAK
ncbi:MAG: hypothetical protein IAE97_14870 [Chthoniobacterales bacterium]|nr:hypothetical protein [Chthoniobacterales bacterium]